MSSYSRISVNGLDIEMRDLDLYVNGKLYGPVDGGVVAAPGPLSSVNKELVLDKNGQITGDVHGDLHVTVSKFFGSVTLTINGSVGGSVTSEGDVSCRSIGGSVTAGGDVTAKSVGGAVTSGGTFTKG